MEMCFLEMVVLLLVWFKIPSHALYLDSHVLELHHVVIPSKMEINNVMMVIKFQEMDAVLLAQGKFVVMELSKHLRNVMMAILSLVMAAVVFVILRVCVEMV